MNRQLVRKFALWLAPLLALRALLPIGFMLSADAGGLGLVFCPTQAPALAAYAESLSHAPHEPRHHHQHAGAAADDGQDVSPNSPCPYGLSQFALAVDLAHVGGISRPGADEPVAFRERIVATSGPARAEAIRGPPFYS